MNGDIKELLVDQHTDLSIFTTNLSTSTDICSMSDLSKCNAIRRLLISLSYYDKINIINNENNREGKLSFCNFMDTIYQSVVYDDFHHLTKHHQQESKAINDLAISQFALGKCELSVCQHSDRHFRVNGCNEESINDDELKYFNLYKETMDGLHFYVFHLFDGGLRGIIDEIEDETDIQDDDSNNSPYFDRSFQKMSMIIAKSNQRTNRFKRLHGNKYNISAVNETDDENADNDRRDNMDNSTFQSEIDVGNYIKIKQNHVSRCVHGAKGDDTFLDHIYYRLSSNDEKLASSLSEIVNLNGYDTESLMEDIEIFEGMGVSNISMEWYRNNKLWCMACDIMNKHYELLYLSKDWIMEVLLEILNQTKGYVNLCKMFFDNTHTTLFDLIYRE